jgi:hypothetical protein
VTFGADGRARQQAQGPRVSLDHIDARAKQLRHDLDGLDHNLVHPADGNSVHHVLAMEEAQSLTGR